MMIAQQREGSGVQVSRRSWAELRAAGVTAKELLETDLRSFWSRRYTLKICKSDAIELVDKFKALVVHELEQESRCSPILCLETLEEDC